MFALIIIAALLAVVTIVLTTAIQNKNKANMDALVLTRRALKVAESALRNIASDAGNPVLEAQIALDEINNYHEKELTK